MSNKLMTVKELAEYLNISQQAVYRMTMSTGKTRLPFLKVSGHLRFDPERIKAWMEEREVLV